MDTRPQLQQIGQTLHQISNHINNGVTIKDSPWQILSVIVTLLAVLVALWPTIQAYRKRPKLKFHFQGKKPYLIVEQDNRNIDKRYYCKLRARNSGKTTAVGCMIKLLFITTSKQENIDGVHIPVNLRVAEDSTEEYFYETAIKPDESKYFTFLLVE